MILFPAIDLKDGLAVRLQQGDMARATVFNRDPAAQAHAFEQQGFRHLHVVDLDGAFVLPGLINAHDHLELNHFGSLKPRDRYRNATEWIDDLRPLIRSDPGIRRKAAFPLRDRLFIGGLKNLLAGVVSPTHYQVTAFDRVAVNTCCNQDFARYK